jgi:hypothetical protein
MKNIKNVNKEAIKEKKLEDKAIRELRFLLIRIWLFKN